MIPARLTAPLMAVLVILPVPSVLLPDLGEDPVDLGTVSPPLSMDGGSSKALEGFRNLDGHFIENKGQLDNADVRYYALGDPLSVGLTPTGLILTLCGSPDGGTTTASAIHPEMVVFKLNFLGTAPVEPSPCAVATHPTNYFIGNDASRWVQGARSYSEVRYSDIYQDVDLRLYFNEGMLKYEFLVGTDGDPSSIRLGYEGVDDVRVEALTGDMLVRTAIGTIRDSRPIITSTRGERETRIDASFERPEKGVFGFNVPHDVLGQRPFIIDPGLRFSTYLGSAKRDEVFFSTAIDSDGNIMVGGYTGSNDFPTTPGAYNRTWNAYKAFIAKFDPTLSAMLFSTFYGGDESNSLSATFDYSIDVLKDDRILVVGHTTASNFPVTDDAFEEHYQGLSDGYIVVLSGDGGSLLYSSYFGAEQDDGGFSTALLQDGSLLIMGATASSGLPTTPGVFQTTKSKGTDIFLAKFDSSLKRLVFCTYIGGSAEDMCISGGTVGCDLYGDIYLVGYTSSGDFPTTSNAYRRIPQGNLPDMFFMKLTYNASRLLYGTYLGGDGEDYPVWLHVTQIGQAYVLGYTNSKDFPVTVDAADTTLDGAWDGFILALDQYGYPRYCTLFGGDGDDCIYRGVFNPERDLIIFAGETSSTDLPWTTGCYCPVLAGGHNNIFVGGFSRISYSLRYCTYMGSPGTNSQDSSTIRRLSLKREGELVMAGLTKSTDFPTTRSAFMRVGCGLNWDGYLFVLDPTPVPPPVAPTGFSALAGDAHVRLEWDRHINESYVTLGYALFRGLTPDQLDLLANTTANTTYEDTNVTNGKRYYYEVRAINSMGAGEAAGPLEARPMGMLSEPQNLTASTGEGTVVLTWDPPSSTGGVEVLGYHIHRGSSDTNLIPQDSVISQMNFTDTSVLPGTYYWYAVVAYNERGNGTVSTPLQVKALGRASAPTMLKVNAGNGWVDITWGPPESTGGAPILGYMVFRGPSPEEMAPLCSTSPQGLGHNDTTVEGGVVYYYCVVAMTEPGEGRPTEVLSARPTGVPGPPQGLALRAGDKQVRLTWTGPLTDRGMPVTGYRVYLGADPDSLKRVESLGDVREYTRRELENGIMYYFAVSAVNLNGEGPRCAAIPAIPLGVPDAPVNLTASVAVDQVRLRWNPPLDTGAAPFLDYVVLRGASKDALMPLLASPLRDAREYLDTDVELGATYFYSVLAINPYGAEGPRTDCEEVLVAVPPGAITGLTVDAGDGWVNLTWAPPTTTGGLPVTGYIVLKRTVDGDLAEVAYPGETYLKDVYVDNGITYFYAVRAMNRAGSGPYEVVVNATPWGSPPAPEGLTVHLRDGKAVVRWEPPSGPCAPITGYVLMRGNSLTMMKIVAELGLETEYIDSSIEPGKVYYYTVRARAAVGDGTEAKPARIQVPEDLGLLKVATIAIGVLFMVLVMFLIAGWQRARTVRADEEHEGEHRGEHTVDDQGPPEDSSDADPVGEGTDKGVGP